MKNFSNDQISKFASLFSMVFIAIGIISGVACLIKPNQLLDTIAGVGLTLFIVPFLITEVTLTAGVSGPFLNWGEFPKQLAWFFYVVFFPFLNMWFMAGIFSMFSLYPMREKINGVWIRNDYTAERWSCIIGLYLTLLAIGLIWRAFRNRKKMLIA